MYNLNHKIFINGKLADEANFNFKDLHSAQSKMHWVLIVLQEELWASPEEGKLSAYIQADNDYNQDECHEFMITEM